MTVKTHFSSFLLKQDVFFFLMSGSNAGGIGEHSGSGAAHLVTKLNVSYWLSENGAKKANGKITRWSVDLKEVEKTPTEETSRLVFVEDKTILTWLDGSDWARVTRTMNSSQRFKAVEGHSLLLPTESIDVADHWILDVSPPSYFIFHEQMNTPHKWPTS